MRATSSRIETKSVESPLGCLLRFVYLLDHEFNFITTSCMCRWSNVIGKGKFLTLLTVRLATPAGSPNRFMAYEGNSRASNTKINLITIAEAAVQ